MRKVAYILGILLVLSCHNNAEAKTMLQNHQDFMECQHMLDDASPQIDHMLHMLRMSAMDSNASGYIIPSIVENKEYEINKYIQKWQDDYWFVHIADPDVCRRQVSELVEYVRGQVNSVLQLR